MNPQTKLAIVTVDGSVSIIQDYSGRQIKQTLGEIIPVGGPPLRRTQNGGTMDLTQPQFQLLRSIITYNDLRAPLFNGLWRGALVNVSCAARRFFKTGGTPDRSLVPTTSAVDMGNGNSYFYPYLLMRVWNISEPQFDEWKHLYSGTIELQEDAPPA